MGASRRRGADDPVGVAGWLYADIFLALVVIGLSTAWFSAKSPDPIVAVDTTTTTSTTTTTTTTIPEGPKTFQLSCDEFFLGPDIIKRGDSLGRDVETALAAELRRRGLDATSAKPGIVLVFGGYDGDPDTAGDGQGRATVMAKLLRSTVESFNAVEMRPGGQRKVPANGVDYSIGGSGRFGVLVYFVFIGEPREPDLNCTA